MKKRLLQILFWSIISAAFIGPGTVTTSASAGAEFGYTLIWALLFSTVACYVLQESSARLFSVTGKTLGETIRTEYASRKATGWIPALALISILTGCVAFEAGNIVGAAAGMSLLTSTIPHWVTVLTIGGLSGLVLWLGTTRQIANFLGMIVAVMGLCFFITAFLVPHDPVKLFLNAITPSIPKGSGIVVLGLIGTTVVPYNIFLGSGLKHNQSFGEMRTSLLLAIGIGGLISVAILLTATSISGSFTFEKLAQTLSESLGYGGYLLLGIGLLCAGISSTLTAALAASVTAKSILITKNSAGLWREKGVRYRSVWITVLSTGTLFGLLRLQPEPVIILAQALNGLILPVIAVILFLLMNKPHILPARYQNGIFYNILTAGIVFVTILIGFTNLARAFTAASGGAPVEHSFILIVSVIAFALLLMPIVRNILSD